MTICEFLKGVFQEPKRPKQTVKDIEEQEQDNNLVIKKYPRGKKGDLWIDWAEDGPRMKGRGPYKGSTLMGLPNIICLHHTAGRGVAVRTMKGGIGRGLTYDAIDRHNGKYYQGTPLNQFGWHAGKSKLVYKGKALTSLSKYSHGIEVGGAGKLSGVKDGRELRLNSARKLNDYGGEFWPWYSFDKNGKILSSAKPIPKKDVRVIYKKDYNVQVGPYQKFTEEQEKTLVRFFVWYAGVKPDFNPLTDITSHDIISPSRKNDVGGSLSMNILEYRKFIKKQIESSK